MYSASSKTAGALLWFGMLVCLAVPTVEAAELKRETAMAFDRYVGASEGRMRAELQSGTFLFIDEAPENRRAESYIQLRGGQILVQQVNTKAEGHPMEVPNGLIHDWIGVLFIPNITLVQTIAVVQDFNNY